MKNNNERTIDSSEIDLAPQVTEKVIRIDRVNKVVKGGKRLAFRAFVIAGDHKGNVSFGLGKSKEVPTAIKKAVERAKKSLKSIRIVEGTIPHEVVGVYGASRVIIKPAKPGTGVIAGGAVRILLESAGYKNIVAKSLGSRNAINATQAALAGLLSLKDRSIEEKIRGKKLPIFIHALEEDPRAFMPDPPKLERQERNNNRGQKKGGAKPWNKKKFGDEPKKEIKGDSRKVTPVTDNKQIKAVKNIEITKNSVVKPGASNAKKENKE